ncbi:signal peptidase I [Butyrivibrio sp. X503]|uniref:signal peptidase I n=1 Tax=Butyrivibrio sp. X503 TaxID=2364878 RepID=UPI000EA8CB9D|nr:signal peptidase I [Butyrivibrio sp. X503]RKM57086.1 signal peptidase I [Butyrivibrio sp. X503]
MFRRRRRNSLTFYSRKKTVSAALIKDIFSWICVTIAAVLSALVLVTVFGFKVGTIGDSMEPMLYNGQKVIVNKLAYAIFSPKKGDIIVFLPNGNTNSHYYVKRVVAVPGEKVQIIDGSLYINGTLQEKDDSLYDKMEDEGIASNEIKLGRGEYFVLGDNRNSSEDSRSANIGPVKSNMIVGKAWFKLRSGDNGSGFILKNR